MPLLHLPAAAWGVYAELAGRCVRSPRWRIDCWCWRAFGYGGSFMEHYLLPVIYPAGLTREIQQLLAVTVVLLNVVIYAWLVRCRSRRDDGEA